MKKGVEISKLIAYIVLPIIMIFIYTPIYNWCMTGYHDVENGSLIYYFILQALPIINALMICFISNIRVHYYKTIYLIVSVIYVIILLTQWIIFLPLPLSIINIFGKLLDRIGRGDTIAMFWFGGYLYCLVRMLIHMFRNREEKNISQ